MEYCASPSFGFHLIFGYLHGTRVLVLLRKYMGFFVIVLTSIERDGFEVDFYFG